MINLLISLGYVCLALGVMISVGYSPIDALKPGVDTPPGGF
jgi:hypothetical protein